MNRTEEQQTDQFKSVPSDSNGNGAAEGELQQWLNEGVQLLESKEYKDAIRLFEKVLRVDPDNMTAFEPEILSAS